MEPDSRYPRSGELRRALDGTIAWNLRRVRIRTRRLGRAVREEWDDWWFWLKANWPL